MQGFNKITTVVITFNEADNIARCLTSVLAVSDEVIVLDSYSTDATPAIVQEFEGVRFYQHVWEGYAKAKNRANKLATHDYVLSIDGDEYLSNELQESILGFKQLEAPAAAYLMNRRNYYCRRWIKRCGWYPDQKLRLFDRRLGEWRGEVHEKIVFEGEVQTGWLAGDLMHYAYLSLGEHRQQIELFTDLSAALHGQKRGVFVLGIKTVFAPLFTFFKKYFFQLGLLDGYWGLVLCLYSGRYKHRKYLKALRWRLRA